jgi:hypothetical protein
VSLPSSRNTTYTPASPAKSNDLNDIQDCIIAGKHDDQVHWYAGSKAALPSASAPFYTVDDATGDAIWGFNAGQRIAISADKLRTGDIIKGFIARALSAGANLDVKLWKRTAAAAASQVGTTLSHTGTNVDQTKTITPLVVTSVDEFIFTVRCTSGGPTFYSIGVIVGR